MNIFTPRAQQVLALARQEADRLNHNYVGTEHLLLGLVRLGQGVAVNVLLKLGAGLETIRIEVEKQVGAGPDTKVSGNIPYTPRVKKVLALAGKEAKALNHRYVGTEHILLGLLVEADGLAARVLRTLEIDLARTRQEVLTESAKRVDQELTSPKRQPIEMAYTSLGGGANWDAKQAGPVTESPFNLRSSKEPSPTDSPLHAHLAPGEKLLWSGAPQPKFRLGPQHLPLLFVLLPFMAFLLFPLLAAFDSHHLDQGEVTPTASVSERTNSSDIRTPTHQPTRGEKIFEVIFFSLFFGGFAGVMAYSLGGRFLLDRVQLSSTVYGITNHRVMVATGKTKRTIRSHHLGTATDIRMEEWPDGLGTITFGPGPAWPYRASAFNFPSTLKLENIPDAAKVFQIISQARQAR